MSKELATVSSLEKMKDLVAKSTPTIKAVAASSVNPERLARIVIVACQRNPKLLECAPMTVIGGALTAAAGGLDLEDGTGRAYLVPFFNGKKQRSEAQLVIGYRGYVSLMHNTGLIKRVDARIVHKKDTFSYELGANPILKHVPTEEVDPGPLTHVYCVVEFLNGGVQFEVMNRHQVESHRKRSKQSDSGPWKTDFEEMARKTVIRKAWKTIPVASERSARVAAIIDADGRADAGKAQDLGMQVDENETPTPDEQAPAAAQPSSGAAEAARAKLAGEQQDGGIVDAEVVNEQPAPAEEPDPLDEEPAAPPPPPAKPAPAKAATPPPAPAKKPGPFEKPKVTPRKF